MIVKYSSYIDTVRLKCKEKIKVYERLLEFFDFADVHGWEDLNSGVYILWFFISVNQEVWFKRRNADALQDRNWSFGASIVQRASRHNKLKSPNISSTSDRV